MPDVRAPREMLVNRNLNPLLESLPSWAQEFRPHQRVAIAQIVEAFDRVPVVVLDAPTGAGKTLIAEAVRRIMKVRRAIYMCSTKSLQDQFARDFPYARVLKGRGNYPTERFPSRFNPGDWRDHLSCEDCTWDGESCSWCWSKGSCPYECAKREALQAEVAVVNTSYFLAECNGPGRLRRSDGAELVVADEADTLEGELMGWVSVEISERRMEKLGWDPPAKVTVKSSWAEWLDEKIPEAKKIRDKLPEHTTDLRKKRERRYYEGLVDKLLVVRAGLEEDDSPWIYTGKGAEGSGRIAKKNQGKKVSFKPARVDQMGEGVLWRHGQKWLLMSATVISAENMLEGLGYTGGYEVVSVDSPFPVENRKVVFAPVADMASKNKETAWPVMAKGVVDLVNAHPSERVLIHTVSYDLARFLHSHVSNLYGLNGEMRYALTYTGASGREQALQDYLANENSILVAPSMDRGIDLPGDSCRVQIIAKVPFPNLGDRQITARMHSKGGQTWYTVSTIRTIVQMCGRAVRSKEDWAVTYVLDRQFESGVWSRGRGMIPQWFRDAVIWDNRREGGGRNNLTTRGGNGRVGRA